MSFPQEVPVATRPVDGYRQRDLQVGSWYELPERTLWRLEAIRLDDDGDTRYEFKEFHGKKERHVFNDQAIAFVNGRNFG